MARVGKIAQLPKPIREELNTRLDNGQQGPELLAWLNATPEAQAVCAKFDGKPINAQNLSVWRSGGYEDWRKRDDLRERLKLKAERCFRLAQETGGNLSEGAAAILGGQFLDVLERSESLDPGDLVNLTRAVVALRVGDQANIKLKQAERDLDRKEAELAGTLRRGAEAVLDAAQDQRVREIEQAAGSTRAEKIELIGQHIFGELWRTRPTSPPKE